MVRASGYLQSLDDFRKIPLMTTDAGVAVRLGDVARVQIGPGDAPRYRGAQWRRRSRRRHHHHALGEERARNHRCRQVEARRAQVESAARASRSCRPTIDRASSSAPSRTFSEKLIEEFIVVALVCVVFLFHLRSAFVAIVSLPLGMLMAFIVMHYQGVNANIMSLGGIAIAIGAMVDAAVVMIENAHKHIEAWHHAHPDVAAQRCRAVAA